MEKWKKSIPNTGNSMFLQFLKWQLSILNMKNKTFEVKYNVQEQYEENFNTTLRNIKDLSR